jgi:hypothetical protein
MGLYTDWVSGENSFIVLTHLIELEMISSLYLKHSHQDIFHRDLPFHISHELLAWKISEKSHHVQFNTIIIQPQNTPAPKRTFCPQKFTISL